MSDYEIESPANERIKRLIRLRDRDHRDQDGVFVVEGVRLVTRALHAGLSPAEVYVDGSVSVPGTEGATTVHPRALSRASYRQQSQGIIAVFAQYEGSLDDLAPEESPLFLGAESMEKPGNLGAMLRTADAVGATCFVAIGHGVDPFNPNVVRTSTGALFTVPLVVCDLRTWVDWLRARSIPLIAADPHATTSMWAVDLTGACALLVGAEHEGLSPAARALATDTVSIPMAGSGTDSLNASVSLGVLAYEALRQRLA